jgi:hypothetical protein
MAGMPAMQEQLQAMARERMAPTPCGFYLWMAGMPAMKEQSQAYGHGTHGTHAMRVPFRDGRYACNAGAIAGDGH